MAVQVVPLVHPAQRDIRANVPARYGVLVRRWNYVCALSTNTRSGSDIPIVTVPGRSTSFRAITLQTLSTHFDYLYSTQLT